MIAGERMIVAASSVWERLDRSSTSIEAIGDLMSRIVVGLLTNAVLVLPLMVIAVVVARWSKRPALAHAMWLLVLVKLLTPPLISLGIVVDRTTWPTLATVVPAAEQPLETSKMWAGFSLHASRAPWIQEPPLTLASRRGMLNAPDRFETPPFQQDWLAWSNRPESAVWVFRHGIVTMLGMTWLFGAAWLLTVFHQRLRLLKSQLRHRGAFDQAATARATELWDGMRGLGIGNRSLRRSPTVWLVDAAISPALFGVGSQTRILFPRDLWTTLRSSQRDALVRHELEHFRRGDHWVRGIEAIATILFWWHPAVWWARRELEWHEELCCDAAASEGSLKQRRDYAEALLAVLDTAGRTNWLGSVALTSGIGPVPALGIRLTHIMQRGIAGRLSRRTRWVVLAIALVSLPLHPWLVSSTNARTGESESAPPNATVYLDSNRGSNVGEA